MSCSMPPKVTERKYKLIKQGGIRMRGEGENEKLKIYARYVERGGGQG